MTSNRFEMKAKVWVYPGAGGWHFLTLPEEPSNIIRELFRALNQGWGSIPVMVTIGGTTWETSLFPDKETNRYQLPLKAEVRIKEKIGAGDTVAFTVEIKV